MRTRVQAVAKFAIISTVALMWAPEAKGQVAFPKQAKTVGFFLARAMDSCTPAGMTVPGYVPSTGCLQANLTTDATTPMRYGKIVVSKNGRISLSGSGFQFGDVFRVRLTLRVTKSNLTTKSPPGSFKSVTFADQVVDCPPLSAFTVRPNGAIAASTALSTCLSSPTNNSGLATGEPGYPNNIEIVDASLVSVITGKVVGRPGILR